jgi:diaminohydroxyphosphoribosylaminopyrimidine deaminase/5-amino-6-(5-phosphoribosylamino)uracil reductase
VSAGTPQLLFSDEVLAAAMRRACLEARRWLGSTAPNPPVGAAALNHEGKVLAAMAHRKAGQPHAEALLLRHCREQGLLPKVAAICVTLEPCNHHGRTPPCTEAILAAGIRQVAVGVRDPNPDVKGGGITALEQAGVRVTLGVAEAECRQLLHAFAFSVVNGRPWVTVKRAFTTGGSMIPPPGRKTFTSGASLTLAHRLRKRADAILTGSGTILADNPEFTVRRMDDYPDKRRWLAILDRRRRVPQAYVDRASQRGLDGLIYDSVAEALAGLQGKGVRDVLVEAGPGVSDAVLASGLWCLAVDIHQGLHEDRIICSFNPGAPIPFAADGFDIEDILPLP